MENYELTKFIGKTVSFGTASGSYAIKDIKLKAIEGKVFIFGLVPKSSTSNDAGLDCECAIAWNSVTDFVVFESEAGYVDWMESSSE